MLKILVHGHLPQFCGGKQNSGLSVAMWNIACGIGNLCNVAFCATDIHRLKNKKNKITVFGWTYSSIIAYILFNTNIVLRYFTSAMHVEDIGFFAKLKSTVQAINLHRVITQFSPNILHLHSCQSFIFTHIGVFDSASTVITLHGIHEDSEGMEWFQKRISETNYKRIVFVSKNSMARWEAKYGNINNNLAYIPNTIDNKKYYYDASVLKDISNSRIRNILTVGSFGENKGQQRILEAIYLFNKDDRPYRICYKVVGMANIDQIKIIDKYKSLGVDVKYMGFLDPCALRVLYTSSDFMIMPSINEGFGLVYLESVACGCPVILPRNLAICSEQNLITDNNSIKLPDHTVSSIYNTLSSLDRFNFNQKLVAQSIHFSSWSSIGMQYLNIFMSQ